MAGIKLSRFIPHWTHLKEQQNFYLKCQYLEYPRDCTLCNYLGQIQDFNLKKDTEPAHSPPGGYRGPEDGAPAQKRSRSPWWTPPACGGNEPEGARPLRAGCPAWVSAAGDALAFRGALLQGWLLNRLSQAHLPRCHSRTCPGVCSHTWVPRSPSPKDGVEPQGPRQ